MRFFVASPVFGMPAPAGLQKSHGRINNPAFAIDAQALTGLMKAKGKQS
jgi:hypothetical protein